MDSLIDARTIKFIKFLKQLDKQYFKIDLNDNEILKLYNDKKEKYKLMINDYNKKFGVVKYKKWYEKNKEHKKEYDRKYNEEHREKRRQHDKLKNELKKLVMQEKKQNCIYKIIEPETGYYYIGQTNDIDRAKNYKNEEFNKYKLDADDQKPKKLFFYKLKQLNKNINDCKFEILELVDGDLEEMKKLKKEYIEKSKNDLLNCNLKFDEENRKEYDKTYNLKRKDIIEEKKSDPQIIKTYEKPYIIYKIVEPETGYYYIGYSNDFERAKVDKKGEFNSYKLDADNQKPKNIFYNKLKKLNKHIKDCNFEIIEKVYNYDKPIEKLKKEHIEKCKDDILNCNVYYNDKEYKSQKNICEICNGKYTNNHKAGHFKSKKHLKALEEKNI